MSASSPLAKTTRIAVFAGWHVLAVLGAVAYLPGWRELVLAAAVYAVGMFAVTAGYHRYFAHRSYRTSRGAQLVLAWLAQMTLQKGVLWWAAHHRRHHRLSDQPGDPHSPRQDGFWHAHVGWIFRDDSQARDDRLIPDLLKFPELRWLDRHYLLPPLSLILVLGLLGGWPAMVWGFAVPMLLVQHVTFAVNSLSHLWGTRPYETGDTSRNNALVALATFGEGWHNNHHHFQASARQGFLWWQVDLTWYGLRALASLGLVWKLTTPPARILAQKANPPEAQLVA